MLKLFGMLLIIFSGAAAGMAAANEYQRRYQSICAAADMLEQMRIMLEYEAPTVSQLINGVKNGAGQVPLFLLKIPDDPSVQQIEAALNENEDGFEECDLQKLKELFLRLGSADKSCEQQRLSSAAYYFSRRRESAETETAKRVKLAKSLGLLGGIFAAVLLV